MLAPEIWIGLISTPKAVAKVGVIGSCREYDTTVCYAVYLLSKDC